MGWVDDMIIKLSGGYFSIAGLLNVSAGSIVTEKDKFVTAKGVTKVIQITEMPYYYSTELFDDVNKYLSRIDHTIFMNTYIEAERCVVPISHPTFVSKANKALRQYVEIDALFNSLGKIHQRSGVFKHNGMRMQSFGIEDVVNAKNKSDSYTEVRNHIRSGGGVYFLATVFLHITFPTMESANVNFESVFNFVQSIVKKASKMDKRMGTYLLNVSPSVTNVQGITSTQLLVSQESLSTLVPYRTEGMVSTKGNLLGVDVNKKTPFFLDTYSTDEGSSAVIVGKAGSGKTVFAYHYSLQSMPNETTCIYLDLKGGTISKALSSLMDNYEVINFSGKTAKFINPLVLNKLNSGYEMRDAIDTTAVWLSLMVNLQPSEGNKTDLLNILKSAVQGYYTKMGVFEDNPATYYKSRDMELGEIVEFLGSNKNATTDPDEIKLYNLTAKRVSSMLQEYGMHRNDNAIDITSLFDRDAIIFDFDKDTEVSMEGIDYVRIFSVINFTKQLGAFNKANQRFTSLFADEGNQYINIPGLMEYISELTARARSSNTSVIFITNDLSVIEKDEMSAFRSNIAIYIVGSVVKDDLTRLKKIAASEYLIDKAQAIVDYPGKYRHSFAISTTLKGDNVNLIVKAELPPEIAAAFTSRTIKED